jgi:hypothetical protein
MKLYHLDFGLLGFIGKENGPNGRQQLFVNQIQSRLEGIVARNESIASRQKDTAARGFGQILGAIGIDRHLRHQDDAARGALDQVDVFLHGRRQQALDNGHVRRARVNRHFGFVNLNQALHNELLQELRVIRIGATAAAAAGIQTGRRNNGTFGRGLFQESLQQFVPDRHGFDPTRAQFRTARNAFRNVAVLFLFEEFLRHGQLCFVDERLLF